LPGGDAAASCRQGFFSRFAFSGMHAPTQPLRADAAAAGAARGVTLRAARRAAGRRLASRRCRVPAAAAASSGERRASAAAAPPAGAPPAASRLGQGLRGDFPILHQEVSGRRVCARTQTTPLPPPPLLRLRRRLSACTRRPPRHRPLIYLDSAATSHKPLLVRPRGHHASAHASHDRPSLSWRHTCRIILTCALPLLLLCAGSG
jgi:hypothetical protein